MQSYTIQNKTAVVHKNRDRLYNKLLKNSYILGGRMPPGKLFC